MKNNKEEKKELVGFSSAFRATLGIATAQLVITVGVMVVLALIYLMVTL